jgi:hypothetical protein
MSSERPEAFSGSDTRRAGEPAADQSNTAPRIPDQSNTVPRNPEQSNTTPRNPNQSSTAPRNGGNDASPQGATILVRGETVRDQEPNSPAKGSPPKDKEKTPPKAVSEAKVKLQNRLPALGDDTDVGVQKEHIVVRDGKADLAFTGTLLASAAPPSAAKGHWQEYRIYETSGGKHVFSKVSRSVFAEEPETHEAEVFDPSPSSVPSQLLRSARDLTRSRPLTWMDAAVAFFGYDPLAKDLYRKLGSQFEEHIS